MRISKHIYVSWILKCKLKIKFCEIILNFLRNSRVLALLNFYNVLCIVCINVNNFIINVPF